MICIYCNNSISDGAKFCSKCGHFQGSTDINIDPDEKIIEDCFAEGNWGKGIINIYELKKKNPNNKNINLYTYMCYHNCRRRADIAKQTLPLDVDSQLYEYFRGEDSALKNELKIYNEIVTKRYKISRENFFKGGLYFGRIKHSDDGDTKKLRWKILKVNGDKALVICYSNIFSLPFDKGINFVWKSSDMRRWLNKEFLYVCFNRDERDRIIETEVPIGNDPRQGTAKRDYTKDKLFLLSEDEATTLFEDDNARLYFGSKHDYYSTFSWWLRSPGQKDKSIVSVLWDGRIFSSGNNIAEKTEANVRPAMWIKVDTKTLEIYEKQKNITFPYDFDYDDSDCRTLNICEYFGYDT